MLLDSPVASPTDAASRESVEALGRLVTSRVGFAKGPDIVLSAVLSHTTPKLGYFAAELPADKHFRRLVDYTGFTPLHNATGGRALPVPVGQTVDGLPIGAMLSSTRGSESPLLRARSADRAAPSVAADPG